MRTIAGLFGSLLLFAIMIALTGGYVGDPSIHLPETVREFFICTTAGLMVIPAIVITDRRLYQGRKRRRK